MGRVDFRKLGGYELEVIEDPITNLGREEVELLVIGLDELITENWGRFGKKFVNEHIISCHLMAILKDSEGNFIGFATVSKKNLAGRRVYYYEFTVIDKAHQSKGLAQVINKVLTRKLFLENIIKFKFSLEFFVITPNMKVMASLAKHASFMYPNPFEFDLETKKIPEADDVTWKMTRDLIRQSDNPHRKLSREGNVLEGSYKDTPWLIYEEQNVPKHRSAALNEFGEHYLGYKKKEGKEFVVRVIFNLESLVRSFFK